MLKIYYPPQITSNMDQICFSNTYISFQEQVYIESFLIKVRQFFFQIFLYIYFFSNKKKVKIKINILEKTTLHTKIKIF